MPLHLPSQAPITALSSGSHPEASDPHTGMRPVWLVIIASVWIATVCNIALWRELGRIKELTAGQTWVIDIAMALLIGFAVFGIFSLLAWRWTLKPVITLFLFSAAFGAYFMLTYNIVIDKTMIINTLQTDVRETRDLLSWGMLFDVTVLAVLPSIFVWRQKLRPARPLRKIASNALAAFLACVLLTLTVLVFFQSIASVMRNYPHVRYLINPLNSFYALGRVAAKPFERNESVYLPLGEDARLGATYTGQSRPPLLLLVLGETARSGNFAVNGYARPTTPELGKERIASQLNAWSCGTSTAASVPCMFSNLGRMDYDSRPANHEGLLDVLERAGLAVLWIDNQSGCKTVCDRITDIDTTQMRVPELCPGGECFDEIMLRGIDARIAALPAERRARGVVVVMHQMGGHGPAYYQRSPAAFKKFLPECTSNALQNCERQSLLNAYDNSVVYTDHFLSLGIQWLKAQEKNATTAMVYVADHGESLGENNLYLHGMPYGIAPDVQKHVPWITWLSPGFEVRSGIRTDCLNQRRNVMVTHDNYFHSVLGIMNVETSVYKPAMDMYAPCKAEPAAAPKSP
jgi:lipid A ethanolaminephosphotransferase